MRRASHYVVFDFAFDLGAPAAPPRSAGEAGAVRSLCLRPAGPSLGTGPLCRAPEGTPKGRRRGCVFFGYFILHKQKKVTRSPQGSETTRSRERICLRSEKATPWIPACAGMTELDSPAAHKRDEIASSPPGITFGASASPPRNDVVGNRLETRYQSGSPAYCPGWRPASPTFPRHTTNATPPQVTTVPITASPVGARPKIRYSTTIATMGVR